MPLQIHRASRADQLADGLGELLRTPLPDPFASELVVVPAKGVERWLSQRLSHVLGAGPGAQDGVCAGVDLWSPGRLRTALDERVLGSDSPSPWSQRALVWPVLSALDSSLTEPWARVLAEHLGHESAAGLTETERGLRQGRRFAVARRLAGLFVSYAEQRPALLEDWEAGGCEDGGGRRLPVDLEWQPQLWRRVVGQASSPSPGRRHLDLVGRLEKGEPHLGLPPRLSVFGPTRLSEVDLEVYDALARHREVHLWLPHPSPALWDSGPSPVVWRRDDESARSIANPLLAAMGRDARELQSRLQGRLQGRAGPDPGADPGADSGAAPDPTRPPTVLGDLQRDVVADAAPSRRERVDSRDTSVQVHACHGPARQVEVLREVLMGMLAGDPTLEPRDVLVMCPDIEVYAPLISGAFGLGESVAGAHPGHRLRVTLADRSPTSTNPLLGVLSSLLDLADGRAEASRVLDLLGSSAVRRRFGFTEDDLETMTTWVSRSGIRWAWDAAGRRDFGLADYPQNTWRLGLDRVLTGVALSEDSRLWLGPVLPFDDVSTSSIGLVGRFAEALDRLQALTEELTGAHPSSHWLRVLGEGVEQVAEPARGEEWQLAQLRTELAAVAGATDGDPEGPSTVLRLPDVRAMLGSQLAGRPTRASFRTGSLTVCTMTPMRSVPHRVVCLLGLDDGVFPRGGASDGDDVLARFPRTGERDLRSQDRQLFLDAVMAAEEALVITYTGFDEATGQPRPPSVPLREFLDVVGRTTSGEVVREHRSQAYHRDYLQGPGERFSFDPSAVAAARAAAGDRPPPPRLHELRLAPAPGTAVVDLDDLVDAVTFPVRAFLRKRMEIEIPRDPDTVDDAMPVDLRGLAQWQVGERVLRELLEGRPVDDVLATEWRRGQLPPGRFGWRLVQQIAAEAGALVEVFDTSTQGITPRTRDVEVDLGDGRRVVGSVTGLHDDRLVRVGYSRLGASQRLEAWVSLVALSAAGGSTRAWKARAIGRGPDDASGPARATYSAPDDPLAVLRGLVDLHDLAMTRVLPTTVELGREVARLARVDLPDWKRDRSGSDAWHGERVRAEHLLAWGRKPTWAELVAEQGAGTAAHLMGELATRLWGPALAGEVE